MILAPQKIEVSRYELRPSMALGASGSNSRTGALLRVDWGGSKLGYADLHPWVELGDQPIDVQLGCLKEALENEKGAPAPEYFGRSEGVSEQVRQSLFFAWQDASARFLGISHWQARLRLDADPAVLDTFSVQGLSLSQASSLISAPPSHFFGGELSQWSSERVRAAGKEGFKRIKLKAPAPESENFLKIARICREEGVMIRLDFNSRLSAAEFDLFLRQIQTELDVVDFIEDPTVFDAFEWIRWQQKYPLKLALDRLPSGVDWTDPVLKVVRPFSVMVAKPAIQDVLSIGKIARALEIPLVVTTYLDHPLGQLCAAWMAAQWALLAPQGEQGGALMECGLLSHSVYETPGLETAAWSRGPELLPPQGPGWGMEAYLNGLHWEPLGLQKRSPRRSNVTR